MRNKGFFWFLTILLTVICLYQLSFTFVSSGIENEAEQKADKLVDEMLQQAKDNGQDSVVLQYSGVKIAVNSVESREIAKADYINGILSNKNEDEVYPILGTKFKDVKKQSLALGLDLVGGMSITMEISIPGMVENYGRDIDPKFKRVKEAADERYKREAGDYIDIFVEENAKQNNGAKLARIMATHAMEGISRDSDDEKIVEFLREIESSAMDGVEEIINRRINQFGVAQPNIQLDKEQNRIYVELPGVQDEKTVAEKIGSVANLEFYETKALSEISADWNRIIIASRTPLGTSSNEVVTDGNESDSTANDSAQTPDSLKVEDSTELSLDDLDEDFIDNLDGTATDGNDGESTGPKTLEEMIIPAGNGFTIAYVRPEDKEKVRDILKRSDLSIPFVKFMFSEQTYEIEPNVYSFT